MTDEQIKQAGHEWKKALGINPYRLQADKDFQAGATWMRDLNKQPLKEPFDLFWKRLEAFIANVQVNDPMSEEEKDMILGVCKRHIDIQ